MITAQEAERTRISRELHDDLSQRMVRLFMRLARWRQGMREVSAKSRAQFETIVEMASEVSASLRDPSHLLHPATLATLGLVPSIAGLCRKFSEQHNVTVKFDYREIPKNTPPDLSVCLFRVVQESLQNIVKHSHAQEARVAFMTKENQEALQRIGGLGLISMRERARLVGWNF
jgi:signal transduction histidine kinase